MANFTLDDPVLGVLAGGQFQTAAFEMDGEFREVTFSLTQAGLDEDAEVHWFEFFYKLVGVSHEDI